MDWLDRNKIKYQVLDVTSDKAAWDEMFRLTNQSFAPVIEVDGEVLFSSESESPNGSG